MKARLLHLLLPCVLFFATLIAATTVCAQETSIAGELDYATEAEAELIRRGHIFFPPKKLRPLKAPPPQLPPASLAEIDQALRALGLPGIKLAPLPPPPPPGYQSEAVDALQELGLAQEKNAPLANPQTQPVLPRANPVATSEKQTPDMLGKARPLDTQVLQNSLIDSVGPINIGSGREIRVASDRIETNLSTTNINRIFKFGIRRNSASTAKWGLYVAYAQPINEFISSGLSLEKSNSTIDYSLTTQITNASKTLSLVGALDQMQGDIPFAFQTGSADVSIVQRSKLLSLRWLPWADKFPLSPSFGLTGWNSRAQQTSFLSPIDYTVDTGASIDTYTDARTLSLGSSDGYYANLKLPITEFIFLDHSVGQTKTDFSDDTLGLSKRTASITSLSFRSNTGFTALTRKNNASETSTDISYEGSNWNFGLSKATSKVTDASNWKLYFGVTSLLGPGTNSASPAIQNRVFNTAQALAHADLVQLSSRPKEFDNTFLAKVNPNAVTLKSSVLKNSAAPVASAGTSQIVSAGSLVTLDASSSTDADGQTLTYAWTQNSGIAVTLSSATDASPTFEAPSMNVGDPDITLTFSVAVSDGAFTDSSSVTITVTAASTNSNTPFASAGTAQSVVAGSLVSLDGSASSDADGQPLTYAWVQTGGPTVTLSDSALASPTFTAPTLNLGDSPIALVFTLTVSDGSLNSSNSVTVTVNAPQSNNNPPVASTGNSQTVNAGSTVTLDASNSSDADGQTLSYAWTQTAGTVVTLNNPTLVSPTFVAPTMTSGDADLILVFSVTASDGTYSSSDSVTITVTAPTTNASSPVASAGSSQSVSAGQTVTLDASASSDADGQTLTYAWTQTAGTAVTLSGASSVAPTFTAPAMTIGDANITLAFTVTVSDGTNSSSSAVSITVSAPSSNASAPVAVAGNDQTVAAGASVTLNASASYDADGQSITYSWTQTSGIDVSLSSTTSATPSFIAPTMAIGDPDQVLSFYVTVSDGILSNSDVVVITVQAPGTNLYTPVATAGIAQSAVSGATVTLNGGESTDADGQPLSFSWAQSSGTSVTLSSATAASPTFVAPTLNIGDADTVLVFTLTVSDGVYSSSDTVQITTTAPLNTAAPVASAGSSRSVASGSTITLDGSNSSDVDGQTLSYAWTQTSGTLVTLNDANLASPTFNAPARNIGDANLSLVFQLTVSDGTYTNNATVTITVLAPSNTSTPVASAGSPQTVRAGENVRLDASGSTDLDGQTLSYAWSQTAGQSVSFISPTNVASPTFIAPTMTSGDADLILVFSVTASDGTYSSSDSVTITVTAPTTNASSPVASAGSSQSVSAGQTVTLDASASSDADGQTLTYAWTQTAGTAVTLSGASSVAPTFTAPAMTIGDANITLAFTVTVSDGTNSSSSAVSITVSAPSSNASAPVAVAGNDQTVAAGASVTLNASASYDADGQSITYSWTQTSGIDVSLSSTTSATPTFTAPNRNSGDPNHTLVFFVTVSDGALASSDSISVTVIAP